MGSTALKDFFFYNPKHNSKICSLVLWPYEERPLLLRVYLLLEVSADRESPLSDYLHGGSTHGIGVNFLLLCGQTSLRDFLFHGEFRVLMFQPFYVTP